MSAPPLDTAVLLAVASLRDAGVPNPDILFLLGTGADVLPKTVVESLTPISLVDLPGIPEMWMGCTLRFGSLPAGPGTVATVWVLDDVGLDTPVKPGEVPFERGFPCWLAANAGASLLIHTSAAGALAGSGLTPGELAVVRDHINLSGSTPLYALGESKLGPLFPDVSQLHSPLLRQEALDFAQADGIALTEVTVACAAPVSLATPAERDWFRVVGADAWIQGLANPLLAAAHAGLSALALTAITADSDGATDIPAMLVASTEAAPKMVSLLERVLPAAANFVMRPSSQQENA